MIMPGANPGPCHSLIKGRKMSNFKQYTKHYVDYFLSLKCSGDVLNVVAPIQRAQKEITESMAVIQRLRPIAIKNPMEGVLVDLCAGNALTSVLATHLLPFKKVVAVDIKKRKRDWNKVKRFEYIQADINDSNFESDLGIKLDEIARQYSLVFISVHPCGDLAERVIAITKYFCVIKAKLILMPCCKGQIKEQKIPACFNKKLTKYDRWAWYLAELSGGKLSFDNKVLSPCRAIIEAG